MYWRSGQLGKLGKKKKEKAPRLKGKIELSADDAKEYKKVLELINVFSKVARHKLNIKITSIRHEQSENEIKTIPLAVPAKIIK